MIQFACPKCKRLLSLADEHAGRIIACPICGQQMKAPSAPAVAPPPSPPPAVKPPAPPAVSAPVPPRAEPAAPKAPAPKPAAEIPPGPVVDEENPFAFGSNKKGAKKNGAVGSADRIPKPKKAAREEEGDDFSEMVRGSRELDEEERDEKLRVEVPENAPQEVRDLGVPSGCFHARKFWLYAGSGMAGCGLMTFVFIPFALALQLGRVFGTVAALIPLVVGVGLVVGGIFLFRFVVRKLNPGKVLLYPDGLVQVKRQRFEIVLWKEVTAAYQSITRVYNQYGAHVSTHYKYTVERADGKTFTFTGLLADVERLGTRIMMNTTRVLLPKILEQLSRGKPADFKTIRLDSEGVTVKGKKTPWSEVKRCKVSGGTVSLFRFGESKEFYSIPFGAIPNPFIFIALVNSQIPEGDR
jgi:hypothetical protein